MSAAERKISYLTALAKTGIIKDRRALLLAVSSPIDQPKNS